MEEKNSKKEVRTSFPVKTGVKAGLFNAMIKAAKEKRKADKSAAV
jgi:hypothetical protein